MHTKLIKISLKYRLLVLFLVLLVTASGIYQYTQLSVDAFPDISPVMVPVFTEVDGMSPEEIERLVTFPVESVMNGLPSVKQVKSTSAFGMSVVYVYFNDDVDIYFARQIVSERLVEALSKMPNVADKPKLGPISTGLGQIFMYYLALDEGSSTNGLEPEVYLRDVNDWVVKYQLQSVPGVTDILSIGGHVLQYQIDINPYKMQQYKLTIDDVVTSLETNNRNVGGQYLVIGNEESLIRGIGQLSSIEDIRNITVKGGGSVPIKISDIASVTFGKEIRRGVVTRNGSGEVVSGLVLQLYGQNTSEVIDKLYEKVDSIRDSLPEGVSIVPYYEQQELVKKATTTVKNALLQGAVISAVVLVICLGNFRTALIVVMALPFSVFISIILMRISGISANLMSLGGIAIAMGMLVDGSIVMVENIYSRLNHKEGDDVINRTDTILSAALEVVKPIVFAILIVITVFMPILTLKGVEGKMFAPMSYTLCFALFGSLIFAVFIAAPIASYILHMKKHKELKLFIILKKLHDPLLFLSVKRPLVVLFFVLLMVTVSAFIVPNLGTEFIPTLEEGSILIGVTMSPSISLDAGVELVQKIEQDIMTLPKINEVISRTGRPEAGSHPHPVNYAEIYLSLDSSILNNRTYTKSSLIAELETKLKKYPGVQFNFTQPIQNAFDELLSGVKAQIAIKVYGEDLNVLEQLAVKIRNSIDMIDGLHDLSVEQSFGQPQIQIIPDIQACSRYGVNTSEVIELVETAIGGRTVTNLYQNTRTYAIQVRYAPEYRDNIKSFDSMMVMSQTGNLVPLKQLVEIRQTLGPIQINRENNQRRWIVQGNVRGRDLGGVASDIKQHIKENIELPKGYFIEYGGQYENQIRSMHRLSIIIPIVIFMIFVMLFLAFGSIKSTMLVMLNIPLALIGGIVGLYITHQCLSVPATIGFIALFGIAIQDSMVLVSRINQLYLGGLDLHESVIEGCHQRFRPVIITSLTTVLGLMPLFLATGIGSEVQRPLAIVVIFGLTSSTILTLFVIPAFYKWFKIAR